MFAWRQMRDPIPRWELPDTEMPASAASQLIRDELQLDGNPLLNLASFVTTWMEPEADELFSVAASKNFIDAEEYPRTADIENRCVNIIANLFGANSEPGTAVGTSTVGSSEAILLAGLALKRRWQHRRTSAGKPTDAPNLVLGRHVHVCWEKLCRYFEVEPRWVPVHGDAINLDLDAAVSLVDENTIGVVAVLGNTFTGAFDDVAGLSGALDALADRTGIDVPIHVDAASGGFVAPFVYPDLAWDFRVPRVRSINTSGHKYGLVYPGVGWAVWRSREDLPDELVFHDNYLGNDQITFSLNFSKGAAQIIGQYYNLIRLGRDGYRAIMANLCDLAGELATHIDDSEAFTRVSTPDALPLVSFRLADESRFSCHDIAGLLRQHGWIVPAYTLPPASDDTTVLRVVVREGFNQDLMSALITHATEAVRQLRGSPPDQPVDATGARPETRVC
jgi:glutamate decarboxylase